ncbi:MAG: LuxR family transcriptional regulator [Geobacteraceae bacterium]|nr:LuxR family transcriptional regulator [Geobacteraceae bacterium]
MDNLSEIIKKRLAPGILIFDLEERLLYSNPDALDVIPSLKEAVTKEGLVVPNVPEEILDLCRNLKENMASSADILDAGQSCIVLENGVGNPCSLRAFFVGHHGVEKNPSHIMVLVEKIAEKHEPDFAKAKIEFDLSKREIETLRLICCGFSNKAISEKMFISECTVKSHIKKIMQKMNVRSRSEIVALLK